MFSNKHIGLILVIIGIVIIIVTYSLKVQEDFYIRELIDSHGGVCMLENDFCLHNDRNWAGYIVSWVMGASLVILALYLLFFDRSYEQFKQERISFQQEIRSAKIKDEFKAFLSGFTPEEQSILRAVHDQEGIKQSTLRFRVGMSKAMLSLMLNSLEKRDIISRKTVGKTKEVYLRTKF